MGVSRTYGEKIMSGPYCETCSHYSPDPLSAGLLGECLDPSKIIYVQCGDAKNSPPDVEAKNECSNHETN